MKKIEKLKTFISSATGYSKKNLMKRILSGIIIFIIGATIGFYINSYLNFLNEKVDITATLSPYIQKGFDGDFLPLILTNIGDKTIHNIRVGVITPIMFEKKEKSEVYIISSILPKGGTSTIPFGNKDTIADFERISCSPYSPKPSASLSFMIGSNLTNTTIQTICGYCNYTVYIFSDEINTSVNSVYPCPMDLTITLSSQPTD